MAPNAWTVVTKKSLYVLEKLYPGPTVTRKSGQWQSDIKFRIWIDGMFPSHGLWNTKKLGNATMVTRINASVTIVTCTLWLCNI
jgi:hypothetical protein